MRSVSLVIGLPPTPKPSIRGGRNGGYFKRDSAYARWKAAALQLLAHHQEPILGPVAVVLLFVMPRVKDKKVLANGMPKGDIDNLEKATYDMCTAIGAWGDDRQIIEHTVKKRYAREGEQPRTEITITETTPDVIA